MESISPDPLRYPVGKFNFDAGADKNLVRQWISEIENLPLQLRNAVKGLNDTQLNTPYRDGGWTVRQVVHHIADSHMNAYIRFKLALTEDTPVIKPYLEKMWAEMDDSTKLPVDISLALVESLHHRMVYVLKTIKESDLGRTVYHPESKREMSIKFLMALYAWHSRHHVAHITSLKERNKW
jgi:uncharacterized damage-inducible protein DinB